MKKQQQKNVIMEVEKIMAKIERLLIIILVILFIMMVGCFIFVWSKNKPIKLSEIEEPFVIEEDDFVDEYTITVYNPIAEQCDSTPLITADNSQIDLGKLKARKIKWAAVSRDLLGEVKFGQRIRIKGCKDKSMNGTWEVHDVMNKRYRKRIDLLFHESNKTLGQEVTTEVEFIRD